MSNHVVIVGVGYVGLPLAVALCQAGLTVTGLDRDRQVVMRLGRGESHIDDVADQDIIEPIRAGMLSFTDDPDMAIPSADVVVVCVPTPLSQDGAPDISSIVAVANELAPRLKASTLVVLESTTFPGTTDEVVRPILESNGRRVGRDLFLAFSPERVDPGNQSFGIVNTPKVVGGVDAESSRRAVQFYELFVNVVVAAKGAKEAEMAKLLENTYRHINIALVNEMAKFCHELDIDIWSVIACASTKPFGFQPFYPGPGVGGHCIPIDPNYLSHTVKSRLSYPFRFVELAQEINDSMPLYVARRAQDQLNRISLAINGASVLLLGVTYKAGISDERESPAIPLARRLCSMGAGISYHDPYVDTWHYRGNREPLKSVTGDLNHITKDYDLVILLQAHEEYARLCGDNILDTRGFLEEGSAQRL